MLENTLRRRSRTISRAALWPTPRTPPPGTQCGAGRTRRPVLEAVGPGHAAARLRLSGYLFALF